MDSFGFSVEARDGSCAARAGKFTTPHGEVPTPVFMPVGTQGAVRCLKPDDLFGARIILANTYHLYLQPGVHVVRKAGGLHKFMGWPGPILTDSGGFQVFSLPKKEVSEEGVTFKFEKRGEPAFLSPESSMEIQLGLGSDIAMAFDECIPYPSPRGRTAEAVLRTARWAARSKAAIAGKAAVFGIVQGGVYEDLRRESAALTRDIGFDGYAIGGVSVGEGMDLMLSAVETAASALPQDRPRYVMGVGRPIEILKAVALGVDMFDCVIPTRHARGGVLYTRRGRIRITKRGYRLDMYPPDPSCRCPVCAKFTRAYIHHLFKAGEILGKTLASMHNIAFFTGMMQAAREAVGRGEYVQFLKSFAAEYGEEA